AWHAARSLRTSAATAASARGRQPAEPRRATARHPDVLASAASRGRARRGSRRAIRGARAGSPRGSCRPALPGHARASVATTTTAAATLGRPRDTSYRIRSVERRRSDAGLWRLEGRRDHGGLWILERRTTPTGL